MRIITGIRKGMKLETLEGMNTRPTESRIKESLFNILGNVTDGEVLDIFAGSGAIGLEFLSRGAKFVTFIENEKKAISILQGNINKFKTSNAAIIEQDYAKSLLKLSNDKVSFDYIYVDPPYDKVEYYENVLSLVNANNLLKIYGLLIIEAKEGININNLEYYDIIDKRKYRSTNLYFLRRKED